MALVLAITLIRIAIAKIHHGVSPFTAMTLPVLLAAWLGGWGPGLLATGLSWMAVRWVLISDSGNADSIDGVVFVIVGILISWFAQLFRSERSSGSLSRQQLRLLHEGLEDCALFLLDEKGRIADWGDRAASLFGHAQREIVGEPFSRLYSSEDGEAGVPEQHLQQARATGLANVTGWRVRRDDTRIWCDVRLSALRDDRGRLRGYAHVASNTTDRKQAEHELQKYRTRLEELVAERTQALQESMNRLRNSERMASLGTLSAGLGHDMGNLLLPIRLRLDAIHTKGVPEQLREDLAAIATCADYLQRLSNGLRLLSIDPAQAQATPPSTELTDWWADVQPFLRNAIPKRIELERRMASDLPPVAVPRHLLTQAVFNLVQNAGHAIPASIPGRVCVWAEHDRDGERVRIGVTDNGSGMTEEVRARCLEPFFTSKTRAISTGLGLTLVHGVVQQAGGRLEVESRHGEGTTFTLILPVARVPRSSNNVTGSTAPVRAIVDVPDSRMRTFLGAMLRSAGFDATYGHPGDDAMARLCVAHASVVDPLEIAAFLQKDGGERRCVILGRKAESAFPSNVVLLDEAPPPATVRETFRNLAHDLGVTDNPQARRE